MPDDLRPGELGKVGAALTVTEHPEPLDPVAPARSSTTADRKAATKTTTDDLSARSFTSLLDHLATLTRVDLRYGDHDGPTIPTLAMPTPVQRRAFELLGTPIPLNLK